MTATTHITNERGVGLISTVVVITALLAITVIGVGIARHSFTATEVQTVAEAAATAGAVALLNGGNDSTARNQGQLVAEQNYVEGNLATPSMIPLNQIEPGNFSNGSFSAGLTPFNAVRATANATVSNMFSPLSFAFVSGGGFSSSGQYTVTKRAAAAFSGLGSAQPALPIALCAACFPPNCFDSTCLPTLTSVPSTTNTVAWTGFTSGSSTSTIESFVPAACDNKGGSTPPTLTAGDSNSGTTIQLNNGSSGSNRPDDVRCMVCNLGMCSGAACTTDADCPNPTGNTGVQCVNQRCACLVPVFQCPICGGPLNQSAPVVGFAAIVVDSFNCNNSPPPVQCGGQCQGHAQSINLSARFGADITGPPGGGNFGIGFIVLVGCTDGSC